MNFILKEGGSLTCKSETNVAGHSAPFAWTSLYRCPTFGFVWSSSGFFLTPWTCRVTALCLFLEDILAVNWFNRIQRLEQFVQDILWNINYFTALLLRICFMSYRYIKIIVTYRSTINLGRLYFSCDCLWLIVCWMWDVSEVWFWCWECEFHSMAEIFEAEKDLASMCQSRRVCTKRWPLVLGVMKSLIWGVTTDPNLNHYSGLLLSVTETCSSHTT